MNPLAGASPLITTFFVLVALLVAAGFVYTAYSAARSRRNLRRSGLDPATLQADLAARVMNSPALDPAKPVEQRLAELDDLHRRGVISAEEHRLARARVLSSG